jgi:hypothetical protein
MSCKNIAVAVALLVGFGGPLGCASHEKMAANKTADSAAYSRPMTSPATGIATDDASMSTTKMSRATIGTVNRQNTMKDPSRRRHSPPLPASDVVTTPGPLYEGVTKVPDAPEGYSEPGSYALVIYFNPGHADLNRRAEDQIKSFQRYLVPDVANKIFVAVWPDHSAAMSTVSSDRLNRGEISLVQARLNSIKKAFGTGQDFVGYNMADSNNWLARIMRTRENEMDSVFSKQDPMAPLRDDVAYFTDRGGASKAVIIIRAGDYTGN